MLRETINFTKSISPESYIFRLEPEEGIHIQIKLDDDGELVDQQYAFYKKGLEVTKFLKDCLDRQIHTKFISMNKAFDSKKKIHSCSPFCIAFKPLNRSQSSNKLIIDEVQDSISNYFKVAQTYCDQENHIKWTELFHRYSIDHLVSMVRKILDKVTEEQTVQDKRFKISDKYYVHIYLSNVSAEDYEIVHQKYLAPKVFNKEEFNIQIGNDVYGVSDYLAGYNVKKPFLQHQSATFDINTRFHEKDAMVLYKFSQLQKNRFLPNPLPIFIEKEELNDPIVKIFNREGGKIRYSEIIKEVYERERDLGNYYLLNYFGTSVRDFDFVSSFSYKFESPMLIRDLYNIKNGIHKRIVDIFSFEDDIVSIIFDNKLVQRAKDEIPKLKYFDDIEYNPKYIRAAIFQLVLKYRKSFYDYVYKSKREALNSQIFHDIMQTGILDNLKEDKHHNKEYQIKEKLNIWFSLYEFFDRHEPKNGEQTMAEKITLLQQRMQEIALEANHHIKNDDEFAYAAGQVIYYLLSRSEAAEKSHALLEPFLQKADLNQFKMAISRIFNQYKHDIKFYKGRFEKLMAEVLSFEIEKSLKDLVPMILAGYFAENVIYKKFE